MITDKILTKLYTFLPDDHTVELQRMKDADEAMTKLIRSNPSLNFSQWDEAQNELSYASMESGFVEGYRLAVLHTASSTIKEDRDVILADLKSRAAELPDDKLEILQTVIKELLS